MADRLRCHIHRPRIDNYKPNFFQVYEKGCLFCIFLAGNYRVTELSIAHSRRQRAMRGSIHAKIGLLPIVPRSSNSLGFQAWSIRYSSGWGRRFATTTTVPRANSPVFARSYLIPRNLVPSTLRRVSTKAMDPKLDGTPETPEVQDRNSGTATPIQPTHGISEEAY